jgi:hypothetical protein
MEFRGNFFLCTIRVRAHVPLLRKTNPDYMMIAAVKRLSRLALLIDRHSGSALIWLLSLYRFREASEVTGSLWPYHFAKESLPDNFRPSLLGPLMEGALANIYSWRLLLRHKPMDYGA